VPIFSHQHGDATKVLIEFANWVPLGEEGLWWLGVHLANCGW
jgi:DNA-directed RNA polymerase